MKGGVAERSIKRREASADREHGVVFRLRRKRKTTPAASVSVAPRNFFDDAASPPFLRLRAVALALRAGDARRGIGSIPIHSHASIDRAQVHFREGRIFPLFIAPT